MTNSEATIKFLGTTDTITACECCGRKDLKKTVAISIDGADPVFYGETCAARALKMPAKDVRKGSKVADEEKRKAEAHARYLADSAETDRWFAWLELNGKGSDFHARVESLGGFTAARDLYAASKA